MVSQTKFTLEEFEAFLEHPENADRHFELINGEIIEKVPTEEHGQIIFRLSGELYLYFRQHPIGRGGVEVRHRVPGDKHTSLQPDLSIILDVTTPPSKQGPVLRMPDVAVEVKSPTDSYIGLREKAAYYLEHGTQMAWLIYPDKQLMEVYQPDTDVEILTIEDTLTGGDVLPGFTLPLKVIFGI